MSQKKRSRGTRILVAFALAAVGSFAAVPAAGAAPGACKQWAFTGPTNVKLSTGPTVSFDAVGKSFAGVPATDNRADRGTMEGVATPIATMTLLYRSETFPDDPTMHFMGVIGDDGIARGEFQAKLTGSWEITTPLTCMTAAEQAGNSREVTGDVDVYDTPGGTGAVIGMLEGGEGQRVDLGSGCRDDNWCNIAFGAGPGGTAWVWGDFLK